MEDEDVDESINNVRVPNTYQIKWTRTDAKSLIEELKTIVIEDKDEDALVAFFKANRNPELFFLPLDTEEEVEVYTSEPDESEQVQFRNLNMLQIAASLDLSDTVLGYFLNSHHVRSYNNRNIYKNLPQSIALFNNHSTDSLFLRILVSWGRITTFVSILEGCRGNWTVQTLIEAA